MPAGGHARRLRARQPAALRAARGDSATAAAAVTPESAHIVEVKTHTHSRAQVSQNWPQCRHCSHDVLPPLPRELMKAEDQASACCCTRPRPRPGNSPRLARGGRATWACSASVAIREPTSVPARDATGRCSCSCTFSPRTAAATGASPSVARLVVRRCALIRAALRRRARRSRATRRRRGGRAKRAAGAAAPDGRRDRGARRGRGVISPSGMDADGASVRASSVRARAPRAGTRAPTSDNLPCSRSPVSQRGRARARTAASPNARADRDAGRAGRAALLRRRRARARRRGGRRARLVARARRHDAARRGRAAADVGDEAGARARRATALDATHALVAANAAGPRARRGRARPVLRRRRRAA